MRLPWLLLVISALATAAPQPASSEWYRVFSGGKPDGKPVVRLGSVSSMKGSIATLTLDKTQFAVGFDGAKLAVKAGDKLRQTLTCFSQGPNHFCDGVLDGPKGPIVIHSGSGALNLATGWTIAPESAPAKKCAAGSTSCSERHELPLVIEHLKKQIRTKPNTWIVFDAPDGRWLITGSSVTWDGLRPPEGVDYMSYEIVRIQ